MWGIVTLSTLLYLQEPQLAHQEPLVSKVTMRHEGRAEMGQPHDKSETPTQKERFGGYDCEFVEPPTSAFQTECPICCLILREPYQVTCCGTSFCHTCTRRLQADNSPCPTCREDNFEVFPNKGLNRSLKQLQVYCTHRKGGCQWRGELGELDHHLKVHVERPVTVFPVELTLTNYEEMNTSDGVWHCPPFYTYPQGYKMCLNVFANGHGDGEGTHVSAFAYLMRGEFDDYLQWPFRGHVVIQLCNQLQDKYYRGYTIHFSETTDARVISRVTSGERAEGGLGFHTLIPHNDLNFNPTTNCQYLKNDCLHFQIVAVESLSEPGVLPTERTMTCFEQHKIGSNELYSPLDVWHSPPFYTHPQGYKMCLNVVANGVGGCEGTHVSVFASLMRGEFDDHLKWPFRGHVVIQLCNQLQDRYHRGDTIDFSKTTDARNISRVTSGKRAESGWGCHLIPHNDLNFNPTNNCQYLKNDCLHFQIVAVESLSEPWVLPTRRTMTRFEQHKIDSGQWFSPPFYTHPQGYKMCLRVDANGSGKGKGTHVSAFAYLMQGEYDDHLKWPFQGHVVIQLCNQLQDKYHRGHTIDFSETTNARVIGRVTSGERAESGRGSELIPHNDLNFKRTKNYQYLMNDCLHFQIVAVESLSEPGVLPTERTMTSFEKLTIDGDVWYSPPFYTHPQGYKMCLNVYTNGYGDGEGTHVTVSVVLMRGEFDDCLKWPFRGHITVAMLNQLEDNNHTTRTILFTETTDNEVIGRVTEGERSPGGWGYPTFIAHTELNYNPTKNCQYLKYDYLCFRIVKVELK